MCRDQWGKPRPEVFFQPVRLSAADIPVEQVFQVNSGMSALVELPKGRLALLCSWASPSFLDNGSEVYPLLVR